MADDVPPTDAPPQDSGDEFIRVRLPRGPNELLGVVTQRVGFGHMNIICSDKKIRNCRIPGKFRSQIWLREGDVVIVEPWQFEGEKKGDVIYKYRKAQVAWLKKNGHLDALDVQV